MHDAGIACIGNGHPGECTKIGQCAEIEVGGGQVMSEADWNSFRDDRWGLECGGIWAKNWRIYFSDFFIESADVACAKGRSQASRADAQRAQAPQNPKTPKPQNPQFNIYTI